MQGAKQTFPGSDRPPWRQEVRLGLGNDCGLSSQSLLPV